MTNPFLRGSHAVGQDGVCHKLQDSELETREKQVFFFLYAKSNL